MINFSKKWLGVGVVKLLSGCARRLARVGRKNKLKSFSSENISKLSEEEILAFMRHDAHRIEKSFYNGIFFKKREYYEQSRRNVLHAIDMLASRSHDLKDPTIIWAREIAEKFDRLEEQFIRPRSTLPSEFDCVRGDSFLSLVASRRSSRVWAESQPSADLLERYAMQMVEAGSLAPNSGNRQAVRFKILVDEKDKYLLMGLKEEHCFSAPCLIFVGADRRLYGGLGLDEAALYVDAGAATMQMVLLAHASKFGVCWNHFSRDLIESRESNKRAYKLFAEQTNIPKYIEPVAIVAFGAAAFHPPPPPRMNIESFLL